MKSITLIAAGFIVGALAGCAQAPTAAVLERVAPMPGTPAAQSEKGKLIVFSAFETGPPSLTEIDPDTLHHSDYEIHGEGGRLVAKVRNRGEAFGEKPAVVELPPGTYQLVAAANGYGRITLPIVITDEEITVVHLEGDAAPPRAAEFGEAYLVRLPNGRAVGWCATTTSVRHR